MVQAGVGPKGGGLTPSHACFHHPRPFHRSRLDREPGGGDDGPSHPPKRVFNIPLV